MQFTQGLLRAVQQQPDAISTICEGRVRRFAETRERIARFAGGLAALGITRGQRVAVLSLNSDYLLEAYLALAWAGVVMVPVNFRWSPAEMAFSLNDAECVALVVDDTHLDLVGELRGLCPGLRHSIHCGARSDRHGTIALEALIAESAAMDDIGAGGNDLLGIFYTGGTTGLPKGVMLSHRNLCFSALSMLAEGVFAEGGCGLHVAPMFHLADMLMTTCLLMRGNAHVMLPRFSPEALLDLVEQYGITDTLLVPSMLALVVDHPSLAGRALGCLRNILYGASPASEALIGKVIAAFPHARLTQGYGMTESAALITALPWHQHSVKPGQPNRLRSAGRATYDVIVRIIDSSGTEVQRGEIGEIITRGPNVMIGYLNRPEATAEALRDGWLHTGDVGMMDAAGYVTIVDRAKDMIISGGENVYSAEVENAIASHAAVQACAVFGIPCNQRGESVHAAIVLRAGHTLSLEELQTHCRPQIAGYKLPRSFETLEALPLSGAGKVLKTTLRAPHWAGRERPVG